MGVASTPEHIIRDKRLSVGAKATWGALASHTEAFTGNQSVWPGQETLAEYLNVSPRTVHDWLKELETAGYMHVIRESTPQGRKSNTYVLHFPEWKQQPEANRKPTGTMLPVGSVEAEPNQKPTGSQPEANRKQGSDEGLEGSEGLKGSEGSAPVKPTRTDAKVDELIEVYNSARQGRMPECKGSDIQRKAISAALKREPLTVWIARVQRGCKSALLKGDRGSWRAELLWMLKPVNAQKIDDGNYDDVDVGQSGLFQTSKADEAKAYYERGNNA